MSKVMQEKYNDLQLLRGTAYDSLFKTVKALLEYANACDDGIEREQAFSMYLAASKIQEIG